MITDQNKELAVMARQNKGMNPSPRNSNLFSNPRMTMRNKFKTDDDFGDLASLAEDANLLIPKKRTSSFGRARKGSEMDQINEEDNDEE